MEPPTVRQIKFCYKLLSMYLKGKYYIRACIKIELPHCTTYSESVVEVEDPAEDVDHVGHEALELVVAAQHLAALLDHDIIRVPQLCHGYFIFWTIQLYNFFDNSG